MATVPAGNAAVTPQAHRRAKAATHRPPLRVPMHRDGGNPALFICGPSLTFEYINSMLATAIRAQPQKRRIFYDLRVSQVTENHFLPQVGMTVGQLTVMWSLLEDPSKDV